MSLLAKPVHTYKARGLLTAKKNYQRQPLPETALMAVAGYGDRGNSVTFLHLNAPIECPLTRSMFETSILTS